MHQPAQGPQQGPGQPRQQQGRGHKTAQRQPRQLGVARRQRQQHQPKPQSERPDSQGQGRLARAQFAPQHPQGRDAGQVQHRRQAKGQQQAQAQAKGQRPGLPARQRQINGQQSLQQTQEQGLNPTAERQAQQTGNQTNRQELQGVNAGNAPTGQAQHAQHRAFVQMALGEVPRCESHPHGRQQGGQQGHQAQEHQAAIQGLAQFWAAALQRLQARPAPLTLRQSRGHARAPDTQRRLLSGLRHHGPAVPNTAARLNQSCRLQIRAGQHQSRCKSQKARAAVGLGGDHPAHQQLHFTQPQAIPDIELQGVQYRLIDPDLARRRRPHRSAVGEHHAPPQRVVRRHRLDSHQTAGAALRVVGPRHAGKAARLGTLPTGLLHFSPPSGRCGLVAGEHDITANELCRIAHQPLFQAIHQQGHRTDCGHRQAHADQEQAQLAGACVAPKALGRQAQQGDRRRRGGWVHVAIVGQAHALADTAPRVPPNCGHNRGLPAGVVQWQDLSFPSSRRGFDSHRPLQMRQGPR